MTTCILALVFELDIAWSLRVPPPDNGLIVGTDDIGQRYPRNAGGIGFWLLRIWLAKLARDAARAGVIIDIVYLEGSSRVHRKWLPRLEEFSARTGTPIHGVSPGDVKRHIAGHGNCSLEAVSAAVEALGHKPASPAEAMAIGTLIYAETQASLV